MCKEYIIFYIPFPYKQSLPRSVSTRFKLSISQFVHLVWLIDLFTGCYRFFADGSFLRFLSYDEQCIGQKGTCVHKVNISAPIFTENGNCSLNWEGSEYSRHGYFWNSVGDYENHYFDLETTHEDSVKLLKASNHIHILIWMVKRENYHR